MKVELTDKEIVERLSRLEAKISNGLSEDIREIKQNLSEISLKITELTSCVAEMRSYYVENKDIPQKVASIQERVKIHEILTVSGLILIVIFQLLLRFIFR